MLANIYKKRKMWAHKGDFGRLLVVGGSERYSGSPIFNAMAAYRAGCDLVTVAAPQEAARIVKSYLPDMICQPLHGEFSRKHVKVISELQKQADAMVIGCGLGRTPAILKVIREIIRRTNIPAVIDADALHAIDFKLNQKFVLTPHTYEFFVISQHEIGNDLRQRKKEAMALARKLGCTILLKGHIDVITDGKKTKLNRTGNPFMTKGGFGDTLAGICGALLARKIEPFRAACASAYINGKAGDLAAKKWKEGTMASDLISEIPNAIKK